MPTVHRVWLVACLCFFPSTAAQAADWFDVAAQVDPEKHAVAGQWNKSDDGLRTNATTGSRIVLPVRPRGEYDFRVSFTRKTGVHSVALFFVAGGKQGSFEIDAWGQHLAGIQNIRGQDLRSNPSRVANQTLKNGQRYTAEIRVRRDRVEAWLDDQRLLTHPTDGSDLSLSDLWKLPDATTLGLGAWEAETVFHRIELRRVEGDPPATTVPANPLAVNTSKPAPSAKPTPTAKPAATSPATGKPPRVLLVIANQHFFYREYADPRQELERAGCLVEVAAGWKQPCHPHQNSGEGGDGGVVRPDLTIAEADATRYDAILFSGGWGSSMYQFAFQGSYNTPAYNGDRPTKEAVNRLINEFVKQDKYVCGLCHGVSVLAWSRVNGRSLLAGKRATGPPRAGPDGLYPDRRTSTPSRWNAEINGARMVAANSIGDPSSAADDIAIDGKIMTGQDDISAREMGRQLAQQLLPAE